jgi:cytochrome c oxidase cbb3-type subunit 3
VRAGTSALDHLQELYVHLSESVTLTVVIFRFRPKGDNPVSFLSVILLVLSIAGLAQTPAQTPPAQTPSPQTAPGPPTALPAPAQPVPGAEHKGGFVPGQKRAPEDPAVVSRGKTLFEINCRSCHGPDLRGGDMGGPNLLRSPATLSDQHGEQIVPIIHGARQKSGMPAINVNDADAQAIAAYVRSVISNIGVQGKPPGEGDTDPDIVVGNAEKGKVFFDSKCSGCHSAATDLKGLATRIPDQKRLQTTWVAGGHETEIPAPERTPTAEVTLVSGETIKGMVVRIDEFLITLKTADGSERSIVRVSGSDPKIVLHDPLEKHRAMLSELTDSDIHDVTAYLVTLK